MDNGVEQANANEGADPTDDIRKQNPGEQTASDAGGKPPAEQIDKDDPHKVEKLSKLGSAGEEAAEGTE